VSAKVTGRSHGDAPAASKTLLASLYGDIRRQDLILTRYLPGLLDRLGDPAWWFIRYRDPNPHLRLRIALPEPGAFGRAARVISTWVGELQQAGLLSQVTYPTSHPETGRWGSGTAWQAAEEVFRTDSRAVLAQLGEPRLLARQALAAAQAAAIAVAFTGSIPAGMRWLTGHIAAGGSAAVPRPLFDEAVRIADPTADWAALRALPAGEVLADSWASRDRALARYRCALDGSGGQGISTDDVLGSLIHVNHVRSRAIDFGDEAVVLHLARSAALSWTARTRGKSA
jgi:thiopeptide-type bacteriocin biosynthesis protein